MLLDTPEVQIGWQAQPFTLRDPDGNSSALAGLLGEKGLVVAFICNHCPYVQRIAGRLAADTRRLMDEGIAVLAIMSNDYENYAADAPENMQRFARQHGFLFPYLVDHDQSVGRRYGAICTPDFFGFNSKGELQYRGRLDDADERGVENRTPELVNAMQLIAATGRGPQAQTPCMGCSIKWRDESP